MLNLGTLRFGLGVDTTGLQAAVSRVEAFGRTVQGAQIAANRGFETSIAMLRRQENTILAGLDRLRRAQESINKMELAPNVRADFLNRLNAGFDQLTRRATSAAAGLDPTKIDRARASFQQLTGAVLGEADAVQRSARAHSAAATAALNHADRVAAAMARAREQALNLNSRIENSGLAAGPRTQLTTQVDAAFQRFQQQLNSLRPGDSAKQFQREWQAALGAIRRDFATAFSKNPDQIDSWRNAFRGLGDAALFVNGHLGGVSTRMFALSGLLKNYGAIIGVAVGATAALGGSLFGLSKGALTAFMEMQKIESAMTGLTGSTAATAGNLNFVREVADQTGLVFTDLAGSYMRFTASAQAAGMTAETTNEIFQRMSLAAGKMNLSVEDTQGVLRALDQMMSKGTVQAEELRGQLGDRLPGAFAIAARAMGVTTAELTKMMKEGEVVSADFVPKFAKELNKVFGLELGDEIDTLQADLNRARNAIFDFFNTFAKVTGLGEGAQNGVQLFTQAVEAMTAGLETAIPVIAGFMGALAGLAAVWAVTAIAGWVSSLVALTQAIIAATSATTLWSAAVAILNAILAANPIVRIITIVAGLAAGWYGASTAYEWATSKVAQNNAVLSNVSGLYAQIEGQRLLGYQVRSTTAEFIRQIRVQLEAAKAQRAALATELAESQHRARTAATFQNPSLRNLPLGLGLASEVVGATAGYLGSGEAAKQKDIARRSKLLEEQMRTIAGSAQAVANLSTMPLGQASPVPPVGGAGGKGRGGGRKGSGSDGPSVEGAINKVKEFRDAVTEAQMKMDYLFSGPKNIDLIDDIFKARDALRGMSDAEKAAAAAELGTSVEGLEEALTGLITRARVANEQIDAFSKLWRDIDRDVLAMRGLESINQFLKGDGNWRDIGFAKAMVEAEDALRKFDASTPEGIQALEALRERLAALGFVGETTAEALAKFLLKVDQLQETQSALIDLQKSNERLAMQEQDQGMLLQAWSRGANAGEAMERLLARRDWLLDYAENLRIAGYAGDEFSTRMDKAAQALFRVDQQAEALKRMKRYAEMYRDSVRDTMQDVVDQMLAVAEGTKSVMDAVTDLFMNFARRMLDLQLEKLFDSLMQMLFPNKGGEDQAAKLAKAAGASMTASAALAALTASASAASAALIAMASSAGGEGGGGGGGIAGAIAGVVGALFGGKGKSTTQPKGRALGGPVSAGWTYRMNEAGTKQDEIFVPHTAGVVDSIKDILGQGGGRRGGDSYDFSTTIDARGASLDAIQALKDEMRAREARLRSQVPILVDARFQDSRARGRYD